jgi:alpha-L-fucosidase
MTRERVNTAVILALGLLCLARCGAAAEDRAEWLYQARWGVFIHYLGKSPDLSVAEWNRLVDGFDVEGLANQLQSAGAAYLVITIGQNSGHYLSPNRTYDVYVGIRPSKCSKRDLVLDLSKALEGKHIRLMVYLPAGAPDRDEVAMNKLEWTAGPDRNANFQRKWENVIGEWSARWGAKVWGWWFDGCYWPNAMYRSCTPPNFKTFVAAARKGNPQSAVAFNPGVTYPIIAESEQEDYTAGEIDDPGRVQCGGRFVDGKQFHMLSYLGQRWSGGEPRFSDGQVVEWSTAILQHGGVVTWDVPTSPTGLIPQSFLRQLKAIGEAARYVNRERYSKQDH